MMHTPLSVPSFLLGLAVAGSGLWGSRSAVPIQRSGEDQFACVITNIYTLKDDGTVGTSGWSKQAAGDQFTVSRATGGIVGKWLPTTNATYARVLRLGDDSEWAFEAEARFDVGMNHTMQVVHIEQYRPGARKPFVAAAFGGAGIVSGLCELKH